MVALGGVQCDHVNSLRDELRTPPWKLLLRRVGTWMHCVASVMYLYSSLTGRYIASAGARVLPFPFPPTIDRFSHAVPIREPGPPFLSLID